MKRIKVTALFTALLLLLSLAACAGSPALSGEADESPSQDRGQIYLYGEQHGVEKIIDREFELWQEYYINENMRHLFIELPYFTAELLNIWMLSDNDDILDAVYNDWAGTLSHTPSNKEFFSKIKSECPETVFHGTDVGHQHDTTGTRFLQYLEDNGMTDSEQYLLTLEAIGQGKYYYENDDDEYRENTMAENFIREFDKLTGESVMGIYGAAHTGLDAMAYRVPTVPCMANQLRERYGDAVNSEDLSWLAKEIEPLWADIITVNGKDYEASYFGEENTSWSEIYAARKYWRLENAYDDFKDMPKNGNILPYNEYPMLIEEGQVFVIEYTKRDGFVERWYLRSDGRVWEGLPSTEEFTVE